MIGLKLKYCLGILLLMVILSGCSSEKLPADQVQKYSDPMAENILTALSSEDYAQLSKNFDDQMKGSSSSLNANNYQKTIADIRGKIGGYVAKSKQFVSAEKKDGFITVTYNAKFENEPKNVVVRSVFSEKEGQFYISGFWLDSPKLQ